MKRHGYLRHLTCAMGVLLITSVSAFAKNSRTVRIPHSASIGGKQIPAGEYKVSWESHSADATVTFEAGKNVVATAQGKWVERGSKYDRNSVVYDKTSDGSESIVEIRFAGMKQALVLGGSS